MSGGPEPAKVVRCNRLAEAVWSKNKCTGRGAVLHPQGGLAGLPRNSKPPNLTRMRRSRLILVPIIALIVPFMPIPAEASTWRSPLDGALRVVAPFAPGAANWDPGHRGVDLAASPETWVLAAGAGRVVYAGDLAGRGVVSLDHDGLRTTYEPVDPIVSVGEQVFAGEVIGRITATGGHCRCLHWGLKRGSTYFDPMRLLRRIVLKPLSLTPEGAPAQRST